jgi:carbamoyltransferase
MGLAAEGEPRYADKVRGVIRAQGASCRLNLDYFTHHRRGVETTWCGRPEMRRVFSEKMVETFGPARIPESEILPKHADLAASVQLVFEERYFSILNAIFRRTRHRNLCLAGTVALNSTANGKIFENTPFEQVFVHPAPHDAGTSIGAALFIQHQVLGEPRGFVLRHLYYGPEYGEFEIRQLLRTHALPQLQMREEDLARHVAEELASGKIVGWFQGRSEFGRNALGNRSLLADPSRRDLQVLLSQGRARQCFRPACASTTAEAASEYFEVSHRSPFMTMACRIRPQYRDTIAAFDTAVALQTVEQDVNPLYWSLINAFGAITDTPVLASAPFQTGSTAVTTPQQALDAFLGTPVDVLVLGRFLLTKAEGAAGGWTATRAANVYGS